MALLQKLFRAIMPASTFAKMEAESRRWILKCSECSTEGSIWEIGGIRYRAKGSKTTYVRCEVCGAYRRHSLTYSA